MWKRLVVSIGLCLAFASLAKAGILISEVSSLNFGTLEAPAPGTKAMRVAPDGSAPQGSGTILGGTPRRGEYLLSSSGPTSTISIDIQNISSDSPALLLSDFRGIYNNRKINRFPAFGQANPGPSGKMLYLGAKITYTQAVTQGNHTLSFDINIIYE